MRPFSRAFSSAFSSLKDLNVDLGGRNTSCTPLGVVTTCASPRKRAT